MKLIVGNKIWKDLGFEDSTPNNLRLNEGANFSQMLRGNNTSKFKKSVTQ